MKIEKVIDKEFTLDNPLLVRKIQDFRERADIRRIFSQAKQASKNNPKVSAHMVGPAWYEFSEIMPWVLCTFSSKVDNNEQRHFVIQGAYEELGMRNSDCIHSKLFFDSMKVVGLSRKDIDQYNAMPHTSINFLKAQVSKVNSADKAMGFGLGLELPANENIDTVFEGILSGKEECRTSLESTPFLKFIV